MGEQSFSYGKWTSGAYKLAGEKSVKSPLETLEPEEYIRMMFDAGFKIWYSKEVEVFLSRKALGWIAEYPTFIKGVFPHVTSETIPMYSKHLNDTLIKQ